MRISRVFMRLARRTARDEDGFSLVEAMVAVFILVVGAFAVLQALNFGLSSTGLSRQRQTAEQLVNQELEYAHGLNYSNVGLAEPDSLTHSTDPNNPDFWISADGKQYDADGSASSIGYEDLLLSQAAPNIPHGPTTLVRGHTTYLIYDYVTWVDVPGITGTQDAKRMTVVVTWTSDITHTTQQSKGTSLFSSGVIPVATSAASSNHPPVVSCPTSTVSGLTVNFTAVASDPDSGDSIAQYDWNFGDLSTTSTTSPQVGHTYALGGVYAITVDVHDTHGAQASTGLLGCTVAVVAPSPTATGDTTPPTGSIFVNSNQTYTRSTQVTLSLAASDNVGVVDMAFSDNGTQFGSYITYSTTALYTVPSGDGTKTVYVRFRDASGNVSATASDSIILDTSAPPAPTGLTASRATNGKSTTLTWNTVTAGDLAGYAVFRRTGITGSTFTQVSCVFSYGLPNKCSDNGESKGTPYTFYVVATDFAGNASLPSNQVTV